MSDYVGIDIGAKSVVVSVRRAGRTLVSQEFRQTPEGHQALIDKLGSQVVCVVLEATGVYYRFFTESRESQKQERRFER